MQIEVIVSRLIVSFTWGSELEDPGHLCLRFHKCSEELTPSDLPLAMVTVVMVLMRIYFDVFDRQ